MKTNLKSILFSVTTIAALSCSLPCLAENTSKDVQAQENQAEEDQEQAFQESLRDIVGGMTKDQIKRTKQYYIDLERAKQLPTPDTLNTNYRPISMKPGARIERLQLRHDYPTTIIFQDATGQPWPVLSCKPGNEKILQIDMPENGIGNVITVLPQVYYGDAGVACFIAPGHPVNLQFVVRPEQTLDQQVTLRLDRPGPNAAKATDTSMRAVRSLTSPLMLNLLRGVPPRESTPLKTNNEYVESWLVDKRLYIRSPFSLVFPRFSEVSKSGEGETKMYVYEMDMVPLLILRDESGMEINVEVNIDTTNSKG